MTRMDKTNEGRRVELLCTSDTYTDLKPGARGTYEFCMIQTPPMEDQHSIKWDSGSTLMLLEGKDRFRFV